MALEIFRLVGSVFVDTDAAQKSLKKTDKDAAGLGKTLVNGAKSVGKFALGVAGAAAAAGAGILALTESTREYRTEQGKLTAAFATQNFSAETARSTYESLNGVLGDSGQAVEAANHLAMLADNEKDLATWTDICTGVYATFGDSLPIEGLTEAANETAKTGALTGGLADALNWAGVNEDKFQASLDKCATEQERQALITETLNGLYSEASDKYKEINADVIAANEAQDRLNNAMASIGGAMEPFVTTGKVLLAEVLEKLLPALEWAATTVLPWVSNAVSSVSGWFGQLTAKLGESGLSFSSVLTTAQSIFQGAMAFIQGIWNSIGQPVWNLIQQAVLLVAGYFQQRMPQIREFVRTAFTDIQNLWRNNLQPALKAIGDFIQNVLAPVFKFVFQTVIAPAVDSAFRTIKQLWNGSLKPVFQGILDFITGIFTLNFTKAFSGLVSAVGGIFSGLKTVVKAPINAVISVVNAFIKGINKLKIPDWVPGVGGKGINIPRIPELEDGAVLKKGQVGLLEGNGAEAVVPLDKNKKWISAVAQDMGDAIGSTGNDRMLAVLLDILEAIEALAGMGIFIDKKKLVGYLAKDMDKALGQLQVAKGRA